MAYNFLDLVNSVNRQFNEVELTSSNFSSATGFYSQAKEAVNSAVREINRDQTNWPFNHVNFTETVVAGQVRYDYQSDAKLVDFDSFRIRPDTTFGNPTTKLIKIDYEEYLENFVDAEYQTGAEFDNSFDESFGGGTTSGANLPRYVFQTQELKFGLHPAPDNAYILDYEYFTLATDLEDYDDAPTIPVQFKYVIRDGALSHAYAFRDDMEMSDRYYSRFQEGIKDMRTIYINRYDHIRDRRVADTSGLRSRYIEVS